MAENNSSATAGFCRSSRSSQRYHVVSGDDQFTDNHSIAVITYDRDRKDERSIEGSEIQTRVFVA
jgi:hypothetical protein